jgi:hypothetical protein
MNDSTGAYPYIPAPRPLRHPCGPLLPLFTLSTVSNVSSAHASLGGSSGHATPTWPGAVGGAGPGVRARKGFTGLTKSSIVAAGATPTKRPPVPVLGSEEVESGIDQETCF